MIPGTISIHKLLAAMRQLDASDLHIKVGIPPYYRIGGELKHLESEPLAPCETKLLIEPLFTDAMRAKFEETGNVDFACNLTDGERFRVNVFRSGGNTNAAIRRVKSDIPNYSDLHLPAIYGRMIERATDGIVIVVGTTGSGKSSTIAAMVEHINATRSEHIITVEDPVEYRFVPKKSIISQREIGIDVSDYPTALRYIVREDPDVIFIGELRDKETILAAIQAAETGHLVLSTMHAADAMQSFSRILEFFPQTEHHFIRSALSKTLRGICAQKLLPTLEDLPFRLVPATEVLVATPVVRQKIHDGEDNDLMPIMTNREDGMHNFTQYMAELVRREWVPMQIAMDYSPNPDALATALKGLDVKTTTISRVRTLRAS